MDNKKLKFGIYAVLVIALIASIRGCVEAKSESKQRQEAVTDLLQEKELITVDSERRIMEVKTTILSKSKEIEDLLDSINTLGSVEAVTRVVYRTRVDTLRISFQEPSAVIEVTGDSVTLPKGDYLKLPQNFKLEKEWYTVSGGVYKTGFQLDEFSFKNDLIISLGTKKKGLKFWKKDEPVVQVRDINPFSVINSIESFKVEDGTEPRNFTFGIQLGYGVMNSPSGQVASGYYVGVGLNYSIIKF
jgi:hypothetical protein